MLNIVCDGLKNDRNERSIQLIKHTNSDKHLLYFSLLNNFLLIVVVSLLLSSSSWVLSLMSHVVSCTTSTLVSPPHYKRLHPQHLKKEHRHTFPWLRISKIENKSIGICFLLYSIIVVASTLSCVASCLPHSYENKDNPTMLKSPFKREKIISIFFNEW
jgi:hypothetical protein